MENIFLRDSGVPIVQGMLWSPCQLVIFFLALIVLIKFNLHINFRLFHETMTCFLPQPKGEVHKEHRIVTLEGNRYKEITMTFKTVIYQPITKKQEELHTHSDQTTSAPTSTRLQDMNLGTEDLQDTGFDAPPEPLETTLSLPSIDLMNLGSMSNLLGTEELRLDDTSSVAPPEPLEATISLPSIDFCTTKEQMDPVLDNDIFMVDYHDNLAPLMDSIDSLPDADPVVSSDSETDVNSENHQSCDDEIDGIIGEYDVIAQRGGMSNKHPGTRAYRAKGISMRSKYQNAPNKMYKTKISQSLVDWVYQRGGRFFKEDYVTGEWYEMTAKQARIKTAQFLRTRPTCKALRSIKTSN